MQNDSLIDRVIFNFTENCNLPCQFCYIPFDNLSSSLPLWMRIIDRCKEWNPKIIVFGGGDPFIYNDFRALLKYTKESALFIHVDTNSLALRAQDLPIIKDHVDQIGLPLDGLQNSHTKMRNNPKHFEVVIMWLEKLLNLGIRVKINTVVSKINCYDLENLGNLLAGYSISQWCLYQFWPLAKGKDNQDMFALSDKEFFDATQPLKDNFSFTHIDIASVTKRLHSHFFVTHTGKVYSEDINDHKNYVPLGDIFDNDILGKWSKHGDVNHVKFRASLRIHSGKEK